MTPAAAVALLRRAGPPAAAAARWAWAHRTLVLLLLVGLLCSLLSWKCHVASEATGRADGQAARALEEGAARGAGVPVVDRVPQAEADERLAELEQDNAELRAARDAAQAEVGRLTVRYVIKASAAGEVGGKPRPAPVEGEVYEFRNPAPPALLVGDELRLELEGAGLEGDAGARLLVATVGARRTLDGELLLREVLRHPWTEAAAAAPARGSCEDGPPAAQDRAWRVGPVGGGSGQGWLAGGAYARRLELWRWRPEVLVTGAGGAGQGVALAGFLF